MKKKKTPKGIPQGIRKPDPKQEPEFLDMSHDMPLLTHWVRQNCKFARREK